MFTLDKFIKAESDFGNFGNNDHNNINEIVFWPLKAESFLNDKDYRRTIEICEANLNDSEVTLSGRLIYALALYHLKDFDQAADQFYDVLTKDPDNLTALKYLGDIHYQQEDVVTALASYSRVMELDPNTRGLKCEVAFARTEEPSTIKIVRPPETTQTVSELPADSPFMTETMGDLYLRQGQPNLALEIFRELSRRHHDSRFKIKLAEVEEFIARKEKENVS
ncbi:MAG: tetratricopeptide repeat protein [candidate division Zixibacteria bacterium]|nr:tetratricopeptide repeat protein [candidate division Zixibacteria bacterium]